MPLGADPTLLPAQLRQSGCWKGTDVIPHPPGLGTLLFVPKDIHAAMTTICSLTEPEPAQAPVQLHCLELTQARGSPTAPCAPGPTPSETSLALPSPPPPPKKTLLRKQRRCSVPPVPPSFQLHCLQLSPRRKTRFDSCSLPLPSSHPFTGRLAGGGQAAAPLSS